MPDYPDFVNTLKTLHLKKKGNRPKVAPQKFYPAQVELQTQELIREELGEYAYKLKSAAQANGVQGVYDVPGAVPQGFDEKVQKVAEAVSLFQVRAFANFSELAVGERYFPGGNEQRDIILNTWSDNFVNLCKSTNEEMRKKVAGVVSDGVLGGRNIRDLTKDIQNTCSEFTRNKAELIATTEVGKLNTAIARNQSEAAGIQFYEWSAAMDGRTRESHAVMDGKICKWGDDTGFYVWKEQPDGRRKLVRQDRPANAYKGAPGTDFRCRCTALPYVPEYEDDYEAERPKGPQRGVTQEHPVEIQPSEQTLELERQAKELERKLAISKRADERHAARTEEQRQKTLAKWEERQRTRRIKEAAEKRHAARNEEAIRAEMQKRLKTRNKARELAKAMDGIYGIDTQKLQEAIATGKVDRIEKEMKPLEKAKKEIEALGDRIDNPLDAARKYGFSRTVNTAEAAKKTIDSWGNISLEDKKANLEKEIQWVEQKKKYATWELSRDIYKKELGKVESEIKWKELESEMVELEEFNKNLTKKNAAFSKLLEAAKKAAKGDKYSQKETLKFSKAIEKAQKEKESIEQAAGATFDASCFTQARKNKALWATGSSARDKADKALRPGTEKVWATATTDEKKAATAYTEGSGGCNRPLRGYKDSWSNFVGVGKVDLNQEGRKKDIENLTKLIDKSKLSRDVWLNRGVESSSGAAHFLNITTSEFSKLSSLSANALSAKFVGKVYKDLAFVSCGTCKGTGFSGALKMNIYCPKGAKALYAEPFSYFNGDSLSSSHLWDGKSKYPFHSEFETILQRGGRYRCTKAYFSGGQLYMDFDLIGQ